MSAEYYTLITDVGQAKLANAVAHGTAVTLTHFAVGDGDGAAYDPTQDQTALKNEVFRAPINSIRTDGDNPSWVTVEAVIPATEGGWTVREAGVFDADGDLFAIAKYPESIKPTLAEGVGKDLYCRLILQHGNADTVTLLVDPAVVVATRGFVQDEVAAHDADPDAHGSLFQNVSDMIEDAATLRLGKHTLFIPADYIKPRVTNPCADIATLETATNLVNLRYRAFEASAETAGQFGLFLPKSWDGGSIEYRAIWSHSDAEDNFSIVWSLCGVSLGDSEPLDSVFGEGVSVSDTGGATDTLYLTDWSGPVTIAGAGSAEEQIFQISRAAGNAADTLAVDARLHRIELRLTIDKGTD